MSKSSGRSWYRFSNIVRPTREPSPPRRVIEPPLSPAAPPSPPPPPQPLSPPLHPPTKEVQEARPSPVTSPSSIEQEPHKYRHEHETTHQTNILTSSDNEQEPNKKHQQQHQQHESDVMGTESVINISGENKGAIMEIIGLLRRTRGRADEESKSKKHSNNGENLPMDGYVNSNVQIINSSVVYNSTEAHHDPGVHLSMKLSSGFIKDHESGYNSSLN